MAHPSLSVGGGHYGQVIRELWIVPFDRLRARVPLAELVEAFNTALAELVEA